MNDNAIVPYVGPVTPEAAEQRAVAIRTELGRRPDAAVIRAWLQYVAAGVARPKPSEDEIVMLTGVLLDGEYPAAVFNPATRRAAAREFKFWPSAAEVWDLLKPHIEAMGIELPGLDRTVRNASLPPIRPARGSSRYLDDLLAQITASGRASASARAHPAPVATQPDAGGLTDAAQADAAEVDRQLAALGMTREDALKLRDRKAEPETPEYGGPGPDDEAEPLKPGLHVVTAVSTPPQPKPLPVMRAAKPRSRARPGRNL
jgi:hypothetical protein